MSVEEIIDFLAQFELEFVPMKIKPWGYTFGIQPDFIEKFTQLFFPQLNLASEYLSPRFLVVNPNCRLSLQKHNKRKELWKVVKGPVGVVIGENGNLKIMKTGSEIEIKPDSPHRLIGMNETGIVAETWIQLDLDNKSDATDIVRLEDDFQRST